MILTIVTDKYYVAFVMILCGDEKKMYGNMITSV